MITSPEDLRYEYEKPFVGGLLTGRESSDSGYSVLNANCFQVGRNLGDVSVV